jgi:hypothetical protein
MHGRKRWPAMGSAAVTMRYVFFYQLSDNAIQTTSWHGGSVLLLPSGLHSKSHIYPRHVPHDMHTKTRWPPISLTPYFFFAIVTLFVILSEFQRYHNAIFHWYITHGLADPNCILKRRPAYSTCLAIHRFVCYITK